MRRALILLLASSICAAAPSKLDKVASDVLDPQLPQSPRFPDDDDPHRRARYDKDTFLLGSMQETVGDAPVDYIDLIPTIGSVQVDRSVATRIVAGGGDAFVWYTADLRIDYSGAAEGVGTFKNSGTARVTQLAIPAGKTWKVIASLLGPEGPSSNASGDIPAATAPGPLAALAASPRSAAAALSTDPHVFVLGTEKDERAVGPAAAKKLLASWAKLDLAIDGKVREIHTKDYGFVQAHVLWTKGKTKQVMDALLIAVPAADGTWKVVGVHYANLGTFYK